MLYKSNEWFKGLKAKADLNILCKLYDRNIIKLFKLFQLEGTATEPSGVILWVVS